MSAAAVKLVVVTSDFGAAANVGGGVQTTAKSFPLPDEIASHLLGQLGQWTTVSLAFEVEDASE